MQIVIDISEEDFGGIKENGFNGYADQKNRIVEAIANGKPLEQDTVPFDFELYQAGLMDMPKEMIEVLDKISVEIGARLCDVVSDYTDGYRTAIQGALAILDEYKGRK